LIVVSLVKMKLFWCDECEDYDDETALIKSPVKHYKQTLNYKMV